MTISDQNLTFWIKNSYNVLFRGKHGVGKTSIILDAFNRHNLKWQYFSAATMDPWVDFVGVPKERVGEDGKSYLDLVRPKHFQEDQVEAIFMDEFNRASKKVRNAVMELIQFKSINGKKFNNLKLIWAAVNPDDDEEEEYDVEKLDAAQLDRFQVHVDVPYTPVASYFRSKYGEGVSHAAIEWWKGLNKQERAQVSPRRLDYALDIYSKHGDIRHVLPKGVGVSKLLQELRDGPFVDRMNAVIATKDPAAAKKFINDENALTACVAAISRSDDAMATFLPHVNRERLTALMVENSGIADHVFKRPADYERLLKQLVSAQDRKLAQRAQQAVNAAQMASTIFNPATAASPRGLINVIRQQENRLQQWGFTALDRRKAYDAIIENMPDHISPDLAARTLNILNEVIARSQISTIQRNMPSVVALMNHLLATRPSLLSSIRPTVIKKLIPLGLRVPGATSSVTVGSIDENDPNRASAYTTNKALALADDGFAGIFAALTDDDI